MTANRKILMVVPYKARDLEGHALVAHCLLRRFGCETILTNGYRLETKILEHAPDAVVFDHLSWNFKVAQAKLAKSLGMKVVVLPTEGLFQDEEGAVRRAGKLHNASHLPDLYLTWGDYPRRALLKQNLMNERQIAVVGCPRFDFYREPFLKLMPSKTQLLEGLGFENTSAPTILWATNTPYSARDAGKMLARQTVRAKKPTAEVEAHIADHKIQFREHSKVVSNLARKHPEWNFIIKVHPAEWINPYLEMERTAGNIKIAFNSPIRQFLHHADLLLQRNCTTATEAWMFGKPVLNLEIGEYRRPVRSEYADGVHRVFSADEAEKITTEYLGGKAISAEQNDARRNFIADFYSHVDGKAHERCAEKIAGILSPPFYDNDEQNRKNELTARKSAARKERDDRRFVNKFKDLIGFDRHSTLKFWKRYLRREGVANAGLFKAEPEITGEMVEELYRVYDEIGFFAPSPSGEKRGKSPTSAIL